MPFTVDSGQAGSQFWLMRADGRERDSTLSMSLGPGSTALGWTAVFLSKNNLSVKLTKHGQLRNRTNFDKKNADP